MAEWLAYANESATRRLPLNDRLVGALSFLPELGVTVEVFSGGQPGMQSLTRGLRVLAISLRLQTWVAAWDANTARDLTWLRQLVDVNENPTLLLVVAHLAEHRPLALRLRRRLLRIRDPADRSRMDTAIRPQSKIQNPKSKM